MYKLHFKNKDKQTVLGKPLFFQLFVKGIKKRSGSIKNTQLRLNLSIIGSDNHVKYDVHGTSILRSKRAFLTKIQNYELEPKTHVFGGSITHLKTI